MKHIYATGLGLAVIGAYFAAVWSLTSYPQAALILGAVFIAYGIGLFVRAIW